MNSFGANIFTKSNSYIASTYRFILYNAKPYLRKIEIILNDKSYCKISWSRAHIKNLNLYFLLHFPTVPQKSKMYRLVLSHVAFKNLLLDYNHKWAFFEVEFEKRKSGNENNKKLFI